MISLAHKTVFVHIPKCGGQSVEEAFLTDLGLSWEQHRKLLFCFKRPEKNWGGIAKRLAHLRARDYVPGYLPQEVYDRFFSFAIVRDPFARIESLYRYGKFQERMEFSHFVTSKLPQKFAQDDFYATQADYVCCAEGRILVNEIIRLEDLSDTWPSLARRAGLGGTLPHRNKSGGRRNLAWTRDMRQQVIDLYGQDFSLFGYRLTPD